MLVSLGARTEMATGSGLKHKTTTKSVLDLANLYQNDHLNLEPGFQRQSVWKKRDRAKLIESILRNYPLPARYQRFSYIGGKKMESLSMTS